MEQAIKQSVLGIIRSCATVQFCTYGDGYPETRTIMNKMNDAAADFPLYFLTTRNSHKAEQIAANPRACLYYLNPETHMSVTLFGIAKVIEDSISREKHWREDWKAFGYSGANDSSYLLLAFEPKEYKFYVNNVEQSGKIGEENV